LLIIQGFELGSNLTEESLAETKLLPDCFNQKSVQTFIEGFDGKNLIGLLGNVGYDRLLVDVFYDFFSFRYVKQVRFADLCTVGKQH
jgi:hypothetical protein